MVKMVNLDRMVIMIVMIIMVVMVVMVTKVIIVMGYLPNYVILFLFFKKFLSIWILSEK